MMNPRDFQLYYRRIVDVAVAYTNRKYQIWPNPLSSEIHKRKNAVLYRCYATQWHLYVARNFIASTAREANHPDARGELPPFLRDRTEQTFFIFDDIVFNLLSMFDYLAALLGLVITNKRYEWTRWNQLIRIIRNDDHGYPDTSKLLTTVHASWVDKLSGYRAGLYHQKADMGFAEYRDQPFKDDIELRMFLPEQAIKQIPVFKGRDKVEFIEGITEVLDESYRHQLALLQSCFDEEPVVEVVGEEK
jgi:hypothetical protein